MNEIVPTVEIETENGPVRINESDYDKTKHKLVGETSSKTDEFDRQAAIEVLEKAGVQFSKRSKNETLEKLVAELNKKSFQVESKDDKFIIVDPEGVQVGEVHENEQSANDMVELLKG